MRTDSTPRRPVVLNLCYRRLSILLGAGLLGVLATAGCDRVVIEAPTGQEVLKWADPFDKEALDVAMRYYRTDDLSDYTYSLLLVVQNFNTTGVAVSLEVNGQTFERRYIASLTQEVFEITPEMVLQTEATLGLSSEAAEPRLDRPCPFVVRLKQYVSEDGYVLQNSEFVLAPYNVFETMSTKEDLPFDTAYTLDGNVVCPGAFMLVIRDTHTNVIELDREIVGMNEADDDEDVVIGSDDVDGMPLYYHPATGDALTRLGMEELLIQPSTQPAN